MVQFFLGKVALLPDQGPGALVELHPFAIAGFVGCLVNALAMLPLGRKYYFHHLVRIEAIYDLFVSPSLP